MFVSLEPLKDKWKKGSERSLGRLQSRKEGMEEVGACTQGWLVAGVVERL